MHEESCAEQPDNDQAIFAKRFEDVMGSFEEACDTNNVSLAIAIAIHPSDDRPLIFVKGHQFDIAVLVAQVLSRMKADIIDELRV